MTTTGLIFGIVLLFAALIGVGLPFINQRRNARQDSTEQRQRDELLTRYERILATIRDLDEDHQTGKLAPATYQRERQYWTEQGIALLQQIEMAIEIAPATVPDTASDDADDAIERAIAEYREVHV